MIGWTYGNLDCNGCDWCRLPKEEEVKNENTKQKM